MKHNIFNLFLFLLITISCSKKSDIKKETISISNLKCFEVELIGSLKKFQTAHNVMFNVYYNGGNGKKYFSKTHKSTGVEGLTASLKEGVLNNGDGFLIYNVSGVPLSKGFATFNISFGEITCVINFNVEEQKPINFESVGTEIGYLSGTIKDIEGNLYKTLKIGSQQWMAENLKTTKYNDGSEIMNIYNNSQSLDSKSAKWSYYNNDTFNNNHYGKLYNWYTIDKSLNGFRNVCPTDWHIPSYSEWRTLINFLGGFNIAGEKLKEIGLTSWELPNTNANNSSLFTALPGGYLEADLNYYGLNKTGFWWSSEHQFSEEEAYSFGLNYNSSHVDIQGFYKGAQLSIRCVK